MVRLVIMISLAVLAGCSSKAVYDNVQLNNRTDCNRVPQPQYEECIERTDKSFEEYERERKELIGDK